MPSPRSQLARRRWSLSSSRFGREVLTSVVATALGTLIVSHFTRMPIPSGPAAAAKQLDRLSWDVEAVPVRDSRIFDTLAMFSMTPAEPQAWSEPSPLAPALTRMADAMPSHPRPPRRVSAAMPRMAEAEMQPSQRRTPPVQSASPIVLAGALPATPRAESAREPVVLLGWEVPGSRRLPDGREAVQAFARLGDGAASAGRGLADAGASARSTVATLGGALVEAVGLK